MLVMEQGKCKNAKFLPLAYWAACFGTLTRTFIKQNMALIFGCLIQTAAQLFVYDFFEDN